MQFNSYLFIFAFMPAALTGYFLLNRIHRLAGKIILILLSIVFYAYAGWSSLCVLGISILINYLCARMSRRFSDLKKLWVAIPVAVNVGILLYYKYYDFAVFNLDYYLGLSLRYRGLALPFGISFFTFQQIAYVVEASNGALGDLDLLDYLCYILYFPKILMGPLAEPGDFISQLNDQKLRRINWDNVASGVRLFCYGLFKKIILADVFAKAANWGYANVGTATAMDLILTAVCYSFELYFDFSGYSDMATGVSLMLNIRLPMNFDSPYQGISVRDYWRRWHITLTKFLTKYLYIPLGGNRKGKLRKYINIILVFTVSGLWHGANWTYLLWGLLNGIFSVLDELTERIQVKLFRPVRWWLSFRIWNFTIFLFGAPTLAVWRQAIRTVSGMQSMEISAGFKSAFTLPLLSFLTDTIPVLHTLNGAISGLGMLLFLLAGYTTCLLPENNYRNMENRRTWKDMAAAAFCMILSILCLGGETVFAYSYF